MYRFRILKRYWPTAAVIYIALILDNKIEPKWQIDVLDVGHDFVMLIRVNDKAILYGIGAYWQNSSTVQKQIIPFLSWNGIKLEGIIVTKSNGGLPILQHSFPTSWVKYVPPLSPAAPNKNEQNWFWKGLKFEVMTSKKLAIDAKQHDASVLRITDGTYSVLLTEGLTQSAALPLVEEFGTRLASTIMQVPRHGSNAGFSYPLLAVVRPKLVINSVSRYNPWHLPSANIIKKYAQLGIPFYSTHQVGQISLFFYPNNWNIKNYRHNINTRWYHQFDD